MASWMQSEGRRLLRQGESCPEHGRLLQLSEASLPRLPVMGTMAYGESMIRTVPAATEADARLDLPSLGS